jgi:hypothetical protein
MCAGRGTGCQLRQLAARCNASPNAAAAASIHTPALWLTATFAPHCRPPALQVNAKISKTTHLKEMNFEIEKLKNMLIATREKNGGRGGQPMCVLWVPDCLPVGSGQA